MLLCLLAAGGARAAPPPDPSALLARADTIKLSQPAEFVVLMRQIGSQLAGLSVDERQYFLFLQGWRSAYDGKDAAATAQLSKLAADSPSIVIRFRAYAMLSNLYTAERRYHAAFQDLSAAQTLLPLISDPRARAQGLLDAAELYSQVGQYDLALAAAQEVIDQNWDGRGLCMGGQQKLQALFKSGRLAEFDSEVTPTIDSCLKIGQPAYANQVRVNLAERYVDEARLQDARRLLDRHYPEVAAMGNSRLVANFDSLRALVSQKMGDPAAAKRFAARAERLAIAGEFPQWLVRSDRILYQYAKERGEYATALAYHEKYLTARIGYLNGVSARQLAYERVKQEDSARKLDIEALSRKNRVLELEHKLAAKQMEATRLYGVILTLVLMFIGLWAVLTKRSQLHFKGLSRIDGLTGISNRPHFIEQAEAALAYARKSGQDVCLALFDLDHFKSINDRFGHAAGDFVLEHAAARCREYLRRSDIFGRLGGEEFGVLLAGCALEEARRRAEQLRQTIRAIQMSHRGVTVAASASFGIASSAASGYELTRLLAHADAALYRAKRAGRDCVMIYDSAESGEVTDLAAAPPPQA